MSLMVSMSRLSYWTTTRPGIVARSRGAMSMSGDPGHEHAADVDRQVAREAVDAGAQLQPAVPGREVRDRAARPGRDRVELDATHAGGEDAALRAALRGVAAAAVGVAAGDVPAVAAA